MGISFLKQIGGSSLTDDSINVKKFEGDSDNIPDSYVPFRNTHIISMAVSWEETIGAKKIYIGAVEEDSSGYPDCRPEFLEAFPVKQLTLSIKLLNRKYKEMKVK